MSNASPSWRPKIQNPRIHRRGHTREPSQQDHRTMRLSPRGSRTRRIVPRERLEVFGHRTPMLADTGPADPHPVRMMLAPANHGTFAARTLDRRRIATCHSCVDVHLARAAMVGGGGATSPASTRHATSSAKPIRTRRSPTCRTSTHAPPQRSTRRRPPALAPPPPARHRHRPRRRRARPHHRADAAEGAARRRRADAGRVRRPEAAGPAGG